MTRRPKDYKISTLNLIERGQAGKNCFRQILILASLILGRTSLFAANFSDAELNTTDLTNADLGDTNPFCTDLNDPGMGSVRTWTA